MSLSKNSPTSRSARLKLRLVSGGSAPTSDTAWHTKVMPKLRELMGVDAFISWGAKLEPVHMTGKKVVVSVPTPLMQRWLTDNHHDQMLEACQIMLPAATEVEVVLRSFRAPLEQVSPERDFALSTPTYGESVPLLDDDDETPSLILLPTTDVRAKVKVRDVQKLVAEAYGMKSIGELLSQKRGEDSFPMYLALYFCTVYTLLDNAEIGEWFGGKSARAVDAHALRIGAQLVAQQLDSKAMETLQMLDRVLCVNQRD